MKKTNRNIKIKQLIQRLLCFALVQISILLFFVSMIRITAPINFSDIHEASITIEKVEFRHALLNGDMLSIISNSKEYEFPRMPIVGTNEYSITQLRDTINVGETLDIEYVERSGILKKNNTIVGVNTNGIRMRSFEAYNSFMKQQHTISIIVFVFIELFFLTTLVLYIIYKGIELKFWKPVKHK